jgi:hypothetical protein
MYDEESVEHSPIYHSDHDREHHLSSSDRIEGELPSVLLSVFQKQNIDYQNDFYWLAKFKEDRFSNRNDVEKSLSMYLSRQPTPPSLTRVPHSPLRPLSAKSTISERIVSPRPFPPTVSLPSEQSTGIQFLPPFSPSKLTRSVEFSEEV